VTGNGNIFKKCVFKVSGGASGHVVQLHGTDNLFEDCVSYTTSGSRETGWRIWEEAHRTILRGCESYGSEQGFAVNDLNQDSLIEYCYFHDSNNSTSGGHLDGVELYGGIRTVVRRNNITFAAVPTAAINIAPYGNGTYIDEIDIYENFIDGGQNCILVDLQEAPQGEALYIHNVRVYRNWMGGHQYIPDGRYSAASLRAPNNVTAETLAAQVADPTKVYWPTSGPDVNRWWNCADLTPDNTGQIIIP
jgi:hypothetical protein